jgi:hypothetical protein
MKGKIYLGLFALPFFAIGVWMLWSVSTMAKDSWQTRSWVATSAILLSAGYETQSGDESDTYEAYATYRYTFAGQSYTGDRVQLVGGADNIGNHQRDLGNRLAAASRSGATVTVYVNPIAPGQAIIDRSFRWGLLGFKLIFLLLFGGIGFGLLIFAFRTPRDVDADLPKYRQSPWLLNPDWQSSEIRSSSRYAMWGAWGFAAFWNLVSAPLPFIVHEELTQNRNYLALIGLLFPVIGAGLAVWAWRRTREWQGFGATPVTLDPFPGSIGGHVGGRIETAIPYDSRQRFRILLSANHRYYTGSGDDRRQHENSVWQDEIVAHTESSGRGTRIMFRFAIPDDLPESDPRPSGDNHHLWRLSVQSQLPGTDLDREFEIPVFRTATESQHIGAREAGAAPTIQDEVYGEAVRGRVRITSNGMSKLLLYPMGQALVSNGAAILIGGTFAAAGWFIAVHEGARVFGGLFGTVGALVFVAAIYMLFKSLEITVRNNEIISVRRWLGIPLSRKSILRSDFARFAEGSNMQTQSGNRHVRHYKLSAIDRAGKRIVVGENFRGEGELRAAKRFLAQELGLPNVASTTSKPDVSRFELDKALFQQRREPQA